jgi:hypothetical protein
MQSSQRREPYRGDRRTQPAHLVTGGTRLRQNTEGIKPMRALDALLMPSDPSRRFGENFEPHVLQAIQ